MEGQGNPWKAAFLFLVFLVLLGTVAAFAYFLGKGNIILPLSPTPSPSPLSGAQLQVPVPSSPSPAPNEMLAIKEAIYKLTGLDETKAEVTITENTGNHAKGGIKEHDAVGGAYWLAAKASSEWIGVYDGQTHPTCTQIEQYNFPVDMVPECLDLSMNVVTR